MWHQVITLQFQLILLNFSQSYKLPTHIRICLKTAKNICGDSRTIKKFVRIDVIPHEPNKTIQLYIIAFTIFNYPKINTKAKNIVQIPITAN